MVPMKSDIGDICNKNIQFCYSEYYPLEQKTIHCNSVKQGRSRLSSVTGALKYLSLVGVSWLFSLNKVLPTH